MEGSYVTRHSDSIRSRYILTGMAHEKQGHQGPAFRFLDSGDFCYVFEHLTSPNIL